MLFNGFEAFLKYNTFTKFIRKYKNINYSATLPGKFSPTTKQLAKFGFLTRTLHDSRCRKRETNRQPSNHTLHRLLTKQKRSKVKASLHTVIYLKGKQRTKPKRIIELTNLHLVTETVRLFSSITAIALSQNFLTSFLCNAKQLDDKQQVILLIFVKKIAQQLINFLRQKITRSSSSPSTRTSRTCSCSKKCRMSEYRKSSCSFDWLSQKNVPTTMSKIKA